MPIDLSGLITPAMKLSVAKQNKIAEISAGCKNAIIAGFNSSALGSVYHYPCDITDQINLMGLVAESNLHLSDPKWSANFACRDSSGKWDKLPHTAEQLTAVGKDAIIHKTALLAQNDDFVKQIMDSPTEDAVSKITWEDPVGE